MPALGSLPDESQTCRMRILMFYYSTPATTAGYLAKALRKEHEVMTLGPQSSDAMPHDIPLPNGSVDLARLYQEKLRDFKPELFFMVDGPCSLYPHGITSLPIPTAFYAIDSHTAYPSHLAMGALFDLVFLAQKQYVGSFRKKLNKSQVYWLPLACDPEIHVAPKTDKIHDIAFLGGHQTHERIGLINRLSKRFNLYVDFVPHTEMSKIYAASKIVFNKSVGNDLNMRVFEGLASGSMLLTDRTVGNGLEELFIDRSDLVIYDDDTVEELADYYLKHDAQREKIGASGQKKVLEAHTYEDRTNAVLSAVLALGKTAQKRRGRHLTESINLGKVRFFQSRLGQWLKNRRPGVGYSMIGVKRAGF